MTLFTSGDGPRIAAPEVPPIVPLDGTASLPRELLGNKGFGIDAMRRHGLPVPPAFCITAQVCAQWYSEAERAVARLEDDIRDSISWLEGETTRTFGKGPRPLLVSVRSGAAQSMPGMMDTVLNLGMNDEVEVALAERYTTAFARDTRARFNEMYRRIVLGGDTAAALPDDPFVQLNSAIEAVIASWNSPRATIYRQHRGYDDLVGTAVVVQAMVFGNAERRSGTGVLFTRNPMTGAKEPFGEWLAGGQGEDIVSGTSTVASVSALRDEQSAVYDELMAAGAALEALGSDVQDIEFTVEEGSLWLLQTRAAKRSAQATVRFALQMRAEGLINDFETLKRVTPEHVVALLRPSLQPEARLAAPLLAKGLAACPGVASGKAYTDVDEAINAAEKDEDVILVRVSTSPDDVQGMLAARGIVTEIGGATSHAAVVSRELARPAVVGCGSGVAAALNGRLITVDGAEGEVREGILELIAWSEADSPDLMSLSEIALAASPLRAHTTGPYQHLDSNSVDAVRSAIDAGYSDVISSAPLITMLTAVRIVDEIAP